MSDEHPNNGSIVRPAIVVEAGVLVISILLGWLLHRPPLLQMRLTWTAATVGAVATAPLLVFLWACSNSRVGPIKDLMEQVDEQVVPLFAGASSQALALISVLAGIGEECLFRGVLQPELSSWVGAPLAIIVTSALFGLAHFVTPTYAVIAGLIGAYLGALTVLTDNLLVPVVAHALYDFAALKFLLSPARRRSYH